MTAAPPSDAPSILLFGNPNSGKTTLFNRLTGARAKVGNYPGITVERRIGRARLGAHGSVEVIDLPGTYSLNATSPEEAIAAAALFERSPAAVAVVVVDASALARGLYIATQIAETDVPLVIAINMIDEVERQGTHIASASLAESFGGECVSISASKDRGIDELLAAVERAHGKGTRNPLDLPLPETAAGFENKVLGALANGAKASAGLALRATARRAILASHDEAHGLSPAVQQAVAEAHSEALASGLNLDETIIQARYRVVDAAVERAVTTSRAETSLSRRIDDVLTHKVWGLLIFAVVMAGVFELLFAGAEPAVSVIEDVVAWLQTGLRGVLPDGPIEGLVVDGIVAGVGNVVVFVPQIALLFVMIGILEDTGYLARVAFVIDRVMGGVGLNGRAFVPMLSGFACAVPAVMATRTMENWKDRLLTMMVVPLMSCSARLPIYVLVTATVFAGVKPLFGIFSAGAMVLFAMYTLSVVAALGAAFVLRRTVLRGPRSSLVLELPPYRTPTLLNLGINVWRRVKAFLVDAGTIILALTVVLWVLLSYPRDTAVEAQFDAESQRVMAMSSGAARDERLHEIADARAGAALEHSVAGRLGKLIEPVLAPLGMDWRVGVGVLGAFAAREVFVSTLGIVFGLGQTDETSAPLRDTLKAAHWPDGAKLFTPLSGVALMVFFVLACQCMSTLAVVRRESGSWKWPAFMFGYMSVLAYVVTLLVYQVGRVLGFS